MAEVGCQPCHPEGGRGGLCTPRGRRGDAACRPTTRPAPVRIVIVEPAASLLDQQGHRRSQPHHPPRPLGSSDKRRGERHGRRTGSSPSVPARPLPARPAASTTTPTTTPTTTSTRPSPHGGDQSRPKPRRHPMTTSTPRTGTPRTGAWIRSSPAWRSPYAWRSTQRVCRCRSWRARGTRRAQGPPLAHRDHRAGPFDANLRR
jgi:hypothetical protein